MKAHHTTSILIAIVMGGIVFSSSRKLVEHQQRTESRMRLMESFNTQSNVGIGIYRDDRTGKEYMVSDNGNSICLIWSH